MSDHMTAQGLENIGSAYVAGILRGQEQINELIFEGEPLGLTPHQQRVLLDRLQCALDDVVANQVEIATTFINEMVAEAMRLSHE